MGSAARAVMVAVNADPRQGPQARVGAGRIWRRCRRRWHPATTTSETTVADGDLGSYSGSDDGGDGGWRRSRRRLATTAAPGNDDLGSSGVWQWRLDDDGSGQRKG
ncbi:hypothetical protein [Oryza sativa Japonica Group]|uniref:Uncharacterized protein P0431G06.29 n=1 Tax=Oryza sativa subsp. japonica TaxID=39947 RepID=Q5JKZ3_ORYSJ|nr:hypothetical protein [Oryza sativa Japonica Group]